ncbi:cytochrome c [Sphingomonas oligophenolica]|uniref:Cytochrome c n=1 Tax=Sphingomonas oligophenolica TaxID=301154 RepID=A0ABU9Y3X3_9SPHN
MRRIMIAGALATLIATPLLAAAQDAVDTRVAGLRQLGAAFKNVNDELKSNTPQTMILQISARQIRDAARYQYGWFPAGSGPQARVNTKAKAAIWTQPAQFKAAQDAFAAQAAAFMRVTATGNAAAMRVQAKQLGEACAACHRIYRVDDKH